MLQSVTFIGDYLSKHCHHIPGLTTRRLYFELTGAVIYSHPHYAQHYDSFSARNIYQLNSKSTSIKQTNNSNANNLTTSIKLHNKFVTANRTNSAQSFTNAKRHFYSKETTLKKKTLNEPTSLFIDDTDLNDSTDYKYPVNFSCEIYVHSRVNSRIMIRFQSFFIPSQQHLLCDENYLYLFDSNTPQYRAMTEAGGERGLCQSHFPTQPIFTTKSFVTIVFRSTTFTSSSSMNMEPGFKLILTSITDAKSTGVCENDEFFCGYISVEPSQPSHKHSSKRSVVNFFNSTNKTNNSIIIQPKFIKGILKYTDHKKSLKLKSLKQRRSFKHKKEDYGYCIPNLLHCDSIVHCHNARDELPSLRMNPSDLPNQLLHALVGAYLTPADLNNVGCTVYKLNNDGFIQNYNDNNNEKYALVKSLVLPKSPVESKGNLSGFFAINSTASNTLIIGCIILVAFVCIVFACSCYQCCYRKKLRSIQIPNKSNTTTYWSLSNTGKGLKCISQEYTESKLTHKEQSTEANKECYIRQGSERYMIGRSATDGTLNSMFTNGSQALFHTSLYSNINNSQLQTLNRDIVPYNNVCRSASFSNESDSIHQTNNEHQTNPPYSMTTTILSSHQHPLQYHGQYSITSPPPPPPPYPKDYRLINLHTASKHLESHQEEFEKPNDDFLRSSSKLLLNNIPVKEESIRMITNSIKKTREKRADNRRLHRRKYKEHLAAVNNYLHVDHYTKKDRKRQYILSTYSDSIVRELSGNYVARHCEHHNKRHLRHLDNKIQHNDSDSPVTTDTGITHSSKYSRNHINRSLVHTERVQRISHSRKYKACHYHSKNQSAKHTNVLRSKIPAIDNGLYNKTDDNAVSNKQAKSSENMFSAKISTSTSVNERYMISHSESNPLNLSFLTKENTTNSMNRPFSSSDLLYIRHGEYV
ncbi:hypothetical protein MN116_001740 [Schistosoma mekongi]|uniref:CUB domain-containing protein n=1 Tax=Schistosoma mekongi TaxID=38744 RepID=A0AAE1ZIR6_SCHME|nr:hypothetical protein MN116_001740 [Schistosoma mekongi]